VYLFFVQPDSGKIASDVSISAPHTINHAYIYAATLSS
jgi:hypothetical protein